MVKTKILRPIKDKLKYSAAIAAVIKRWWKESFWTPLYNASGAVTEYFNDNNVIIEALQQGRIQYVDGKFIGKFNAKISKALIDAGAKFKNGAYHIDKSLLDINVIHAIAMANAAVTALKQALIKFLDSYRIDEHLTELNDLLQVPLDEIWEDLDDQARKTMEDTIAVTPKFTEEEKRQMFDGYTTNIDLSIKGFTEQQISKLRQLVEQNLFYTNNNESIAKQIEKQFNVSYNKAKFLARQETGLLTAQYRQVRYQRAGITKYRWSTSHDDRVRQMHKDLDGKIFEFANPPITNEKGDRNNPGEDWQCRCEAIPIVENMV